jgi:hypothetical protein
MSLADSKRKKTYSKASEKMKFEVAEVAKKKAEADKIKRDKLQARHVSPGGGAKFKYGPHKVDINRRDTEALFGKGRLQEKFIAFANKFDAKQDKKREAKQTKKKMQKRAKKLTAYESYT